MGKKVLIFTVIVFLVLTQYMMFVVDRLYWFDEAFSAETVHYMRENGFRSIDWSQHDVHSEAYYDVLYFWSYLNPGIVEHQWYRELSVVAGIAFIVFAFFALGKVFGSDGELAVMSLVFFTTYVHYGHESRAYMFVMMLSAIILWGVVNEFGGWSFVVSLVAVALLPFMNYLAVMAIPFFVVLFVVYVRMQRKFVKIDWLRLGSFVVVGGVAAAFVAFTYALPQKARFLAMWLPNSDITSWPDSLLFSFFMTEHIVMPVTGLIIYCLFVVLLGVLLLAFLMKFPKGYWRWAEKEDSVLTVMGLSALFPLVALTVGKFLGLYHHRFFLVVTWMFAAMCMVLLWRGSRKGGWKWFVVVFVVGVVVLLMWNAYASQQARELQRVELHTPCSSILIVHESAFSMMPFQTFSREHGCDWHNVISTDFDDVRMGYSAGFDAVPKEDIYWNLSYPNVSFYKVATVERQYGNRTVSVVYEDDGVNLIFVSE